ncbi:MAG TPA: lamin tail domain-containing protein, partial [Verrucomicrobiae bacterium]|nr:lamin tail domain-containing protein [Verrucomicrobiae bacterium]
TARYGAATIAGQYTASLDNAGERIQLVDLANEEILDFAYNNSWYPSTDGLGFSLVISNELAEPDAWGHREGWRPSGQLNGAPGQSDPPTPVFPGVLISEVLAHTDLPQVDAIELFNPTTSPVNLGGWYLSDDFKVPKKYRITNGCVIAAGGYLAFDASLFNSPGTALVPFALSSKGDDVWLFSGDTTGNLTGYVFGEDFGASATGVSLGRYTNSVGDVHFVAQSVNTLGAANAGPRVGPVVISEIMYHPVDGPGGVDNAEDEFVALLNISGSAVPFYDPGVPANTWRVRGGIDYEFPSGLAVPANGAVLLVNFDTNEVRKLAAFRSRYSVPAAVPVFGPYRGKLDNSSDNIRLERPDVPELGVVPYILVDRVEYSDQGSWPALADGLGASLQRRNLSAYGNDPANWMASAPRAGAPGSAGIAPAITTQPANTSGLAGNSATFTVSATGTAPLNYQWRFNGDPIIGATSASLTLTPLQVNQAGAYSVSVFNSAGSTLSSNAMLSVMLPAFITTQPANVTLRGSTNTADYGYTGSNATFSAVAVGSGNIRYQWRFNQQEIAGATGPSYTVNSVGLTNEGSYDVRVTDAAGSILSRSALLKVLVSPTFLQAPGNQEVPSNGTFTASAVVRGNPPPFRYEWREISSIRAATNTAATTNFFISGPITNTSVRAWRLIVTNEANAVGLVAQFNVTALQDTDGDGIPDSVETAYGFDPGNNADRTLDSDGDGVSNAAEYLAGTDPLDRLSYLKVDNLSVSGGAVVTFLAQSNKTYSVQYTDNLGAGVWLKLGDVVAQPSMRSVSVADLTSNSNRFYRLVTPQRP